MKTFLLLLSFVCLLNSSLSAGQTSLEGRLSLAVLALMDGDEQADQGNAAAATALYEQALTLLRGIQAEDPGFNTNIIEFRIENVEAKLEQIAPASAQPTEASRIQADAEDTTHFERLYIEAKEKALADSQRLLEVERRNLDLQMALRERERTLGQQRDQLQENQRELTRLQRENERQSQDTTRELQDLRRFNNLLQDRANTLETENQELTETLANVRERDADRAVQLQQFRAELLAAEQALEQAREGNEAEIGELRERLSTCAAESRQRFEALDQAYQRIETLQEQVAGLPLLEETVIELNRRLNRQTRELEDKQALVETTEQQKADIAELREMLTANLARLTDTLNELTHARRHLETKEQQVADLTAQITELSVEELPVEELSGEELSGEELPEEDPTEDAPEEDTAEDAGEALEVRP